MLKIILLVINVFAATFAQTTLSGNIGGMTFEASGNPWISGKSALDMHNSHTITISRLNKTLSIFTSPGTYHVKY